MFSMQETNQAVSEQTLLRKADQNEEERIGNRVSETDSLLARQAHDPLPHTEIRNDASKRRSKISCIAGIM